MDFYEKRGYLNQEFCLFHLTDQLPHEIGYHYHDFDKIIIFINGNVDYIIEGHSYHLKPYDIVLVKHHAIHKPVIRDDTPYERIIVYLSPDFINSYKSENCDLNRCFEKAGKHGSDVLQIRSVKISPLFRCISRLTEASADEGYAHDFYRRLIFLEFMIHLNRAAGDEDLGYAGTNQSNEKILEIMRYLYENLTDTLTIDQLADRFYLSKYHMMRLFKEQTGYTINGYINEKRLLMAKELLQKNMPVTEVCYRCGFRNYPAFLRAYKKMFDETPQEYKSGKSQGLSQ